MSTPPGGGVESNAGSFRAPPHPGPTIGALKRGGSDGTPDEHSAEDRAADPRSTDAAHSRLSPATHRALDIWQRDAADRLGLARVTGQEVLTALIDQLLNDPKLSSQVIRSIQNGR